MVTIERELQVAIAGNPNTGKTSLFNRLTGLHQKVGNYPGITVERVMGSVELPGLGAVQLADVPGTYSLSARSEEEQIAIRAIAGLHPLERPDVLLVVVDSTQIARSLYLVLQVIELGQPAVVALNFSDELTARGRRIDAPALAGVLGIPVVPTSARTGDGLDDLRATLAGVLGDPDLGRGACEWIPAEGPLAADVRTVGEAVPHSWHDGDPARRRALALWALLSLEEEDELADVPAELRAAALAQHEHAHAAGRRIEDEIIQSRYGWIDAALPGIESRSGPERTSWTDRCDRLLLHPVLGFGLFLLAMGLVFQSLFAWADPAIGVVETAVGAVKAGALAVLPAGLLRDLAVEGVIEGVGAVLVFLPQILLLFFFIGLMEDSGYMARVAYLMDRVMKVLGLHGRAFVPMLSGFACAVPAILATRTMERRRDRLLTMLVVPLMTCSARLPVYTLVIAALFSPTDRLLGFLPVQSSLMVAMYLFSTVIALVAAAVLGRTVVRGPRIPLILEMPPYRLPHAPSVVRMMWQRTRLFVSEAGSVILVCTIVMWALLSFPRELPDAAAFEAERTAARAAQLEAPELETALAAIDGREDGERLSHSYAGRLGRAIEPTIEPLGFDWKIGVGLIGAFAAREVFVSTMGIVYGLGQEADEGSDGLRERLRTETHPDGRRVYTPLVGLSLMVFFALACQCMSTLAVVKRETRSWRWPLFLFVYMTALAWAASFAVYQGGRLFT